jgi:hypothetical protein
MDGSGKLLSVFPSEWKAVVGFSSGVTAEKPYNIFFKVDTVKIAIQ